MPETLSTQKAFSLDPVTRGKIKKAALIALSGFVISAVPILLPQLIEFFKGNPLVTAGLGAFGSFLVAAAREFVKGQ